MAEILNKLRDVADQEIEMILAKRMEKGTLEPEHLCYLKDLVHIQKDIIEAEKDEWEMGQGMSGNYYARGGSNGGSSNNNSNGGNSGYYGQNYGRGNEMMYPYREEYDRMAMNKMQMAGRYM